MLLHYLLIALLPISLTVSILARAPALTVIPLSFLVLQVLIEGFRWQLAPLYTLGIMVAVVALVRVVLPSPVMVLGIVTYLSLAAFASLLSYAFPSFRMPEPTGPYAVGATERTFSNERGPLTAKVWYPAEFTEGDTPQPYLIGFKRSIMGLPPFIYSHLKGRPTRAFKNVRLSAAKDAYPVIIYSHGGDGFVEDNSFLLTELASHGFVAFAVEHPKPLHAYGFDPQALTRDPEGLLAFMVNRVMPERVRDVNSVIAALGQLSQQDDLFGGRLEPSKLGLLGYSFGGSVMTEVCATQQTCRAVVNLDGNGFAKARTLGSRGPYLHLSQSVLLELADKAEDAAPVSQMAALYLDEVSDIIKGTEANGYRAVWLQLKGSGHAAFIDMIFWTPLRQGPLHSVLDSGDAAKLHATVCELTRTFFEDAWNETAAFEEARVLNRPLLSDLSPWVTHDGFYAVNRPD